MIKTLTTAPNIGLLLWGQTEGNPGITPLFNFGYGVDRLLISFTFKIKIRFFNQVLQPGGHSNNPPQQQACHVSSNGTTAQYSIMTSRNAIPILMFLAFALASCDQTKKDRTVLGITYAEKELRIAIEDTTQHNVIDNKISIIKDSSTAIGVAEPILFSIYGKDNIVNQRPYEIYFIDKYWIISGTLPKDYLGGTFLIIINSLDSKIIRLTHGK